MSTDAYRKCVKCGATPIEVGVPAFHRFPKLGKNNFKKLKAWAQFCWPDKEFSSGDLNQHHKRHLVLCNRHFSEYSFTDSSLLRLSRFAIPTIDNIAKHSSSTTDSCKETLAQFVPDSDDVPVLSNTSESLHKGNEINAQKVPEKAKHLECIPKTDSSEGTLSKFVPDSGNVPVLSNTSETLHKGTVLNAQKFPNKNKQLEGNPNTDSFKETLSQFVPGYGNVPVLSNTSLTLHKSTELNAQKVPEQFKQLECIPNKDSSQGPLFQFVLCYGNVPVLSNTSQTLHKGTEFNAKKVPEKIRQFEYIPNTHSSEETLSQFELYSNNEPVFSNKSPTLHKSTESNAQRIPEKFKQLQCIPNTDSTKDPLSLFQFEQCDDNVPVPSNTSPSLDKSTEFNAQVPDNIEQLEDISEDTYSDSDSDMSEVEHKPEPCNTVPKVTLKFVKTNEKKTFLEALNVDNINELAPREKMLYKICVSNFKEINRLRSQSQARKQPVSKPKPIILKTCRILRKTTKTKRYL